MYPPQTSFIPLQVALARFLEKQGFLAALSEYPYWYLGVPFRYLSGPILVPFSVLLHRLLPGLSLFEIFFVLTALGFLAGVYGVYLLVKELSEERMKAYLAALFYAFFPIIPFLFRFSDGVSLIGFSVIPYILVFYFRFLSQKVPKTDIKLILLISFLLLLDISILPVLILCLAAVFLARADWKKAEERIKKSLSLLLYCLLIVTVWYTPSYWLRVLSAPSLAGKGVVSVVAMIGQILPVALAISLAVVSIRFFKKKDLLRDFCFYFLFIFGFLTLMRFISDPDFWLDWSSYTNELQMGLSILGGLVVGRVGKGRKMILTLISALVVVSWVLTFNKYVLGTLQKDITASVEYKIGNQLSQITNPPAGGGERVFLSGTTTFWLNSLFDVPQVRGGKDKVAPHPMWDRNVWEIRDGERPERALKALKELDVSYLVVHTEKSAEFYHDFTYPEKFGEINELKKIYEEEGDIIYFLTP